MNSVHKPGPNGDSKTSPSRKPGQKPKPGARAPSWPSKHSLRAQTARSWPCRGRPGRVVAEPPSRIAAQGCRVAAQPARPCTPAHLLVPPTAAFPRAPAPRTLAPVPPSAPAPMPHARPCARRPALPSARRPASPPPCAPTPERPSAHACARLLRPACRIVALQRAVSQYSPCLRPLLSQYNFGIAIQFSCSPLAIQSCNTTPPSLQYKLVYCNTKFSSLHPASYCNTVQPLSMQYKPLYCNTKPLYQPSKTTILQYKFFFSQYNLSSSPKRFCTKFFLFNFFFYFQQLENNKKITKINFFFHSL